MKPAPFELLRPRTVDEAVSLLAEAPDETVVLAGGQTLVPLMNMRFVVADRVLDLNDVPELSYIRQDNGSLAIGAMTRHRELELSPLVLRECPLLPLAEAHVGYVAIRQRGTIGGSLAHADTVAEVACVAICLDATIVLRSVRGTRELPAHEFIISNFVNTREPDELLVEVRVPRVSPRARVGFAEFSRKIGDFPLVTAAVHVELDGDVVTSAQVAIGGAGPAPFRVGGSERALSGRSLGDEAIADAAGSAIAAAEPAMDPLVSPDYRRALIGVTVSRALRQIHSPGREERR